MDRNGTVHNIYCSLRGMNWLYHYCQQSLNMYKIFLANISFIIAWYILSDLFQHRLPSISQWYKSTAIRCVLLVDSFVFPLHPVNNSQISNRWVFSKVRQHRAASAIKPLKLSFLVILIQSSPDIFIKQAHISNSGNIKLQDVIRRQQQR